MNIEKFDTANVIMEENDNVCIYHDHLLVHYGRNVYSLEVAEKQDESGAFHGKATRVTVRSDIFHVEWMTWADYKERHFDTTD